MRIVSENSPAEIVKQRAAAGLVWPLRELTANLLRLARGTGKPYEVAKQCDVFLRAILAYKDAVGCYPSDHEIAEALDPEKNNERLGRVSRDYTDEVYAEQCIIDAALQIVASRLVRQRPQEASASNDLHAGIRALEGIRQKWRVQKARVPSAVKRTRKRTLVPRSKPPQADLQE